MAEMPHILVQIHHPSLDFKGSSLMATSSPVRRFTPANHPWIPFCNAIQQVEIVPSPHLQVVDTWIRPYKVTRWSQGQRSAGPQYQDEWRQRSLSQSCLSLSKQFEDRTWEKNNTITNTNLPAFQGNVKQWPLKRNAHVWRPIFQTNLLHPVASWPRISWDVDSMKWLRLGLPKRNLPPRVTSCDPCTGVPLPISTQWETLPLWCKCNKHGEKLTWHKNIHFLLFKFTGCA